MEKLAPITAHLRETMEESSLLAGSNMLMVDKVVFNDLCDAVDVVHAHLEAELAAAQAINEQQDIEYAKLINENKELREKVFEASAACDYALANLVMVPAYANGREVRVGDEVIYDGWPDDVCEVIGISLQANPEHQWSVNLQHPKGAVAMLPTDRCTLNGVRLGDMEPATIEPVDLVNHPPHYTQGRSEAIDVIEDSLGYDGFVGYCVGNALKYLIRHRAKGGSVDLRKAHWYLSRLVSGLEDGE